MNRGILGFTGRCVKIIDFVLNRLKKMAHSAGLAYIQNNLNFVVLSKSETMRKLLLAMLICGAAVNSEAQTSSPSRNIDSMISLTNADYDMGNIPTGHPLEYTVTIKNISKDTLILKEVKAGCGCTTPKYRTNEKILPGKSTYITLGFNGDAHGGFSKVADLYFNDGSLTKQVKFRGVAVADSSVAKPRVSNANK
jgi:hypothetical protein